MGFRDRGRRPAASALRWWDAWINEPEGLPDDNALAENLVTALEHELAPRPGLEPGTCGLTVRRSTD